ncbi:2Fe-2S iron-sulfur cluster-binding protein [Acetobacter tropicalis]|uniref:Ferredoxin n=1 Tax=Acetobacter tropicalis TaxID=104102 RepID=A0A252A739_9PROT|nr:2Fe-2S iron-sulfur cluster-binding protein [Acetobacter tropicalis]OUI85410.1 ferredoxin [Acetobacter tropicalis]
MPELIFRQPDGSTQLVSAENGSSVMQAAIRANVRGIEAECGGACACATCHVYIAPSDLLLIPAAKEEEEDMLDGVCAERREGSRLACQITVTDALGGMIIDIPDRQY